MCTDMLHVAGRRVNYVCAEKAAAASCTSSLKLHRAIMGISAPQRGDAYSFTVFPFAVERGGAIETTLLFLLLSVGSLFELQNNIVQRKK